MVLQRLPCQIPSITGSALGLVGSVSVYSRQSEIESLICNFYLSVAAFTTKQIGPWDTLACCWDVKQQTNNNNNHSTLPAVDGFPDVVAPDGPVFSSESNSCGLPSSSLAHVFVLLVSFLSMPSASLLLFFTCGFLLAGMSLTKWENWGSNLWCPPFPAPLSPYLAVHPLKVLKLWYSTMFPRIIGVDQVTESHKEMRMISSVEIGFLHTWQGP